jgi:molybdopterin molybdotransferase
MRHLLGVASAAPATVRARLSVNLPSASGREDWWPVRLARGPGTPPEWVADPIFGKSNLIFNLARADGLIRIEPDATGLNAGERVDVFPI